MNRSLAEDILSTLKSVLPEKRPIALHEPCFAGNEWAYAKECLDSGWVSSIGMYVERFEKELSENTGSQYAIAVVNGTAALHIALQLIGVEPADEVLVPALTFVATVNAVAYVGAVPHFVDSEIRTLGLDAQKLSRYLEDITEIKRGECFNKKSGRRMKAVVPMHTFGHPVDLDPLVEICNRFKLELIEDAAESLGSRYKGQHTGNWGKLSTLSFNGNKIVTTGGGGAILTNDAPLAVRAKHITKTAKVPHSWEYRHDQIGYNYRMPNINAAIGCAQIEQIPVFLKRKRNLANRYKDAFADVSGVRFFTEPDFAESNYWLNALLLDPEFSDQLRPLLEITNSNGISTRPVWTLMHKLDMFKGCPRMNLDGAEDIERRLINIPSSAVLGEIHAGA